MKSLKAPTYDQLMWPTIKALKALGGSASIHELLDKIIELEGYSEKIQQIPHTQRETELEYNAAWARTHLKNIGAVVNSDRAIWALADKGEHLTKAQLSKTHKEHLKNKRKNKKTKTALVEKREEDVWKEELIGQLLKLSPSAFERLCKRLLRESGFIRVEVTGKPNDQGIDGIGILRVNLISFHVSFQCKRYQNSVGSAQIRDFRGAFVGRGDKGLIITTSSFTSEARKEANRDGAPAIDLIDGDELCELMKKYSLGVETELVEKMKVNPEWFGDV